MNIYYCIACCSLVVICGCSSNYSVKESPYKSATLAFATDPALTAYKDDHLAAIKTHLLVTTTDFIAQKGDLVLKPACQPDGLLVTSTITSLNMPGMKKGDFAEITIMGEIRRCGSPEVLGTFYQHEDGNDAAKELDVISRDIAADVYQFIGSTIK